MSRTFPPMVLKLTKLTFLGAAIGTVLALTVPPTRLQAQKACVCNDSGTGSYQCNHEQTQCLAGSQKCVLTCQ